VKTKLNGNVRDDVIVDTDMTMDMDMDMDVNVNVNVFGNMDANVNAI
jgi:hypothetical protein